MAMVDTEKYEYISKNVVEVLIRLDREVREYSYTSEEFARRINAINNLICKVEKDFGSDFVCRIILRVVSDIKQPIEFNKDVVESLCKYGVSCTRACTMYKFVNDSQLKTMALNCVNNS